MKQQRSSQSEQQFQINRVNEFQPCFQTNASLLSRLFFIWTHKLIKTGKQKPLQMNDLSDLSEKEQVKYSYDRFSSVFYGFTTQTPNKVIKSFKAYLGPMFILAGVLAAISNAFQFSGPIVIGKVLQFLANDGPIQVGLGWVTVLVVCYLLRTVIFQHSMNFVNLSCIRVLNSANPLIYHKIMSLSGASRKYLETGSIMNYINVDVMSFYYFIMMSTFLFSAPVMIVIAIALLILEVGWIGLVAPIIFAFGLFIQQFLMKKGLALRKDQLYWSDKRSKCVNEYFSGIRIIKYYGWENLVADKIENIRKEQLSLNLRVLMIRTYVEVLMNMLPIIISITVFAVYAATEGEKALTPAKVYTVISLFNLIAIPLRLIIMTLINLMNAKASLNRVEHFFGYGDKDLTDFETDDQTLEKGDIVFDACKFTWENQAIKKHYESGKVLFDKNPGKKEEQPKKQEKPVLKSKDKTKKKSKKPKKQKKQKRDAVQGQVVEKKKKKKSKKKSLLTQSDLNQSLLGKKDQSESDAIQNSEDHALTIDKLKISKGQFLGIVGRVGSGKSTLLYSILGQIDKISGSIRRRGSVAYIPQVSWLRSATIRQNILFESPYDQDRYHQILKICELQPDLQILGGGDLTEIGQKGVNLSGGQKQRISIARALYADADIYLIDDCLSALDSYVGKSIFNNVLRNYLHKRGKTVVFVTNAIDFTNYCDKILVLSKGRIADQGTPEQLRSAGGVFGDLQMQYKKSKQQQQQQKEKEAQVDRKKSEETQDLDLEGKKQKENKKEKKQMQGLVKVEQRLKGSVPWKFYVRFFTGPGAFTAILMMIFIFFAQMARVASDWWLGEWSNNVFNIPENEYIWIYAIISLVVGILLYVKGLFFAKFIVATSRVIQRKLIQALLKSPLSWFDVTPTGRILARSTKDQDDLDNSLAFNVQFATQNLIVLFSSIVLISIATPVYLIVAVISGFVYYYLIGLYMQSSRELKRLQANTRAPLISHIQETINGMYVIRAFGKTDNFITKYYIRQKDFIVATVNQNITSRWINLVTDIFSIFTVAAAGYLGVLSKIIGIGSGSANIIGLALVWSLQISSIMSFTLRVLADMESNMNAVVRLYDYIDNNPSEKDFDEPNPKNSQWPTHGNYKVSDASYKYRPELPHVLKSISFDIKENSKIGVVGRTGSGKSTLTLGLLRILQLCQNQQGGVGKIVLDDEDTSELGLHWLRHKITIIPQDPTLFTGTIKTNMDPFNRYSDNQIAQCLKKVELWDQIKGDSTQVSQIAKKVYSPVEQSGANFSLGQRQLICMARALIRKPKVLLMDEATASIDEKTDETIQKMIRKEFTQTTVITIAHRLNTIIYYDKILVLDQGKVQEYQTPLNLVKNQESFLGKLIKNTGKAYQQKIIALAQKGLMKQENTQK